VRDGLRAVLLPALRRLLPDHSRPLVRPLPSLHPVETELGSSRAVPDPSRIVEAHFFHASGFNKIKSDLRNLIYFQSNVCSLYLYMLAVGFARVLFHDIGFMQHFT
jgi:hypothetical protein